MEVLWQSPGREQLKIQVEIRSDQTIQSVTMHCLGSLSFLKFSQKMKTQLTGPLDALILPEGTETQVLIWREVLLKLKNQWKLPVEQEELCHCRRVSTAKVDEAIVYGAHDIVNIRKQTSANTGCATCLPDVEALLKYRL